MAILDQVKLAMRISHTALDSDIMSTIETARMEMIRSGVSPEVVRFDGDPLIIQAIKTYCLFVYSGDKNLSEGYMKSWEYQLDNLRKSSGYGGDH